MSSLASVAESPLPLQAAEFRFGPFRLCLVRRSLWREETPVALTPRALDLLAVLVRYSGRVLSREELRQAVWGGTCVQDSNLTVNLCLLRRALAPDNYIATIPGRGYQFTAPVATELGMAVHKEAVWLTCLPFRCLGGVGEEMAASLQMAAVVALAAVSELSLRPAGAAAHCGSDWTLEGCLQAAGPQLRISAQLVRPSGAVAWARQCSFAAGAAGQLPEAMAAWLQQELAEMLRGGH